MNPFRPISTHRSTGAPKEAALSLTASFPGLEYYIKRFSALFASGRLKDALTGLFLLYLARVSQETYGTFMLAFSAGAVTSKVVEFGLNNHLVKQLGTQGVTQLPYAAACNVIKSSLLLLCTVAVWLFCWKMNYPRETTTVILLICFGKGVGSLADSFFMVFRILGRQITESVVKTVALMLALVFAVVLLQTGIDPIWVGLFLVVESAANLMLAAWLLKSGIAAAFRANRRQVRELLVRSFPFTLIAFFAILANKTNVFFLENMHGASAVALYSSSWLIVDSVSCAVSAHLLGAILYPVLSCRRERTDREAVRLARNTLVWLLALAWPICLVLSRQSDLIIGLVFTDQYAQAAELQRLLVWTIPVAFCQNVCFYLMMACASPARLAVIFGLSLAANIGLNLVIVPLHGPLGAAWVILLTKIVMCSLVLVYAQTTVRLTAAADWLQVGLLFALAWGGQYCLALFMPPAVSVGIVLVVYTLVLVAVRNRLTSPVTDPGLT